MFITSMGIFGFLSKAHIEQTLKSRKCGTGNPVESEIARYTGIIERLEQKISKLETTGSGADAQYKHK